MQHSSQRLQQDLLRQLLLDWSRRPALQVGLLLELVQLGLSYRSGFSRRRRLLPRRQVCGRRLLSPRLPDSSAPEHPDSYHQLPAALVLEAELALAKPTRTRL